MSEFVFDPVCLRVASCASDAYVRSYNLTVLSSCFADASKCARYYNEDLASLSVVLRRDEVALLDGITLGRRTCTGRNGCSRETVRTVSTDQSWLAWFQTGCPTCVLFVFAIV